MHHRLLSIVSWLIFLFFATVFCLKNDYCNLNCEFDNNETFLHTVCDRGAKKCGPGPKCGADFKVVKFDDKMRQFVLDLHNELRNKVAMGKEGRNKQPPAADMKVLTYNKELEFIAQCWANSCHGNPLIHDTCRSTKKYEYVGQNLGFYNRSDSKINIKNTIKSLIMYWYNEVEIFKNEWVNYTDDRGPDIKVGHYTQMLWSDTSEIGCAAAYYTTPAKYAPKIKKWHHLVFVCDYGPGGNYISLPVYKVGKPCSGCPDGLKQSKRYPGLCGQVKRVNETTKGFQPIF